MIALVLLAATTLTLLTAASYLNARRHGPQHAANWRRGFRQGWHR